MRPCVSSPTCEVIAPEIEHSKTAERFQLLRDGTCGIGADDPTTTRSPRQQNRHVSMAMSNYTLSLFEIKSRVGPRVPAVLMEFDDDPKLRLASSTSD